MAGECDHILQLGIVEDLVFRRGLEFNELARRGHYDIHVHIGAGVFFVTQVEQGMTVNNPHAHCSHRVAQGKSA